VTDHRDFLEYFSGLACIIAVDLKVEYGDRRYLIVDGNEAYYSRHPEYEWHNKPV